MEFLEENAVFVEGVWLPKTEVHMREWMVSGKRAERVKGKITYQWWKQKAAMEAAATYLRDWSDKTFVDVGGHCGFWSMWWGLKMRKVVAFEPIPLFQTLFEQNVKNNGVRWDNVTLLPIALSSSKGELQMRVDPEDSGATRPYAPGEAQPWPPLKVTVSTLDAELPDALYGRPVGVLKIDCEGFEENVVKGAAVTIDQHRPLIVVEQKFEQRHYGYEKDGAVNHLIRAHDYKPVKVISGDHIMVPAEFL